MKKRLLRVFSILACFACITASLAVSATEIEPVFDSDSIKIGSFATGNNFFGSEKPVMYIDMTNPTMGTLEISYTCTAKDYLDNTVWTASEYSLKLTAGERIIRGVYPKVDKYGCYELNIKFTGSFGEDFEKSVYFSRNKLNEELNEKASVTFHVGDYLEYENIDNDIELATKAGFGKNRDDVRWYRTETESGYKLPDWRVTGINKVLKSEMESPIYIIGVESKLYTGNLFPHEYNSETCKNHASCETSTKNYTLDEQIKKYGDFCEYMATKLKGTKPIFELGNEVELDSSRGKDDPRYLVVNGATYAKLLKEGYNRIKAVDKDATVITAGTCQVSGSRTQTLINEMLAVNGITDYMDGFAIHSYTNNNLYPDEMSSMTLREQIRWIEDKLTTAMHRDKTSDKKIWITETGSSSNTSEGVSLRQQANNLPREMMIAMSEPMVKCVSFYNMTGKGYDTAKREDMYGIVRKDYTPKPVYPALSFMNSVLCGTKYKDGIFEVASTNGNFAAYEFEKEDNLLITDTVALWAYKGKTANVTISRTGAEGSEAKLSGGQNATITVPQDAAVTAYDMFGNKLADSNTYDLSEDQIYIVVAVEKVK